MRFLRAKRPNRQHSVSAAIFHDIGKASPLRSGALDLTRYALDEK
jgi:hypothetical protein